jgi:protease-4
MDAARVRTLADGRAYTGRQALPLGLVDEIGGETQALHWLQHTKNIDPDLKVLEPDHRSWSARLMAEGVSSIVTTARESLRVDGAWSVWQPFSSRD